MVQQLFTVHSCFNNTVSQLQPKTVHAPEIGQTWLNTEPLTMRGLRGRVVLVDFWDYTCVNCIRTLPYLKEWRRRYHDKGLTIVGVHAPEFYFASVTELVRLAIRDFGIEYAVVLDNEHTIWQAYANRYWPAKYLVDHEGYIRYFHAGEGSYGETERAIQALLRELNPLVEVPEPMAPLRAMDEPGALAACQRPTPELYLGYKRGRIANPEGFVEDESHHFRYGSEPKPDVAELDGPWLCRPDSAEVQARSNGERSRLRLMFSAAEVNVVLAAGAACPLARLDLTENDAPIPADARGDDVQVDRGGKTWVKVDRPRMYSLIRRDRFVTALVELESVSPELQLFVFTFVSCL